MSYAEACIFTGRIVVHRSASEMDRELYGMKHVVEVTYSL